MPDAVELVKTVKKASIDAMESTKPVNICFGTVVETRPVRINVEQKMILNEAQMIFSRNVTDHVVQVSMDWKTEDHSHELTGTKEITIHNGLAVGDEVILVRQQGGQKYLVWDRTAS